MIDLRRLALGGVLGCCLVAASAHAMRHSPMGHARFLDHLFPPQLVMRHQSEIGLTQAQRDAISAAMKETRDTIDDLQWQLEADSHALGELLAAETIDVSAAMAKANEVMATELGIKRAHLGLLIRIKNELTASQRETLRSVAPRERHGGRPRRRGGPDGLDPPLP